MGEITDSDQLLELVLRSPHLALLTGAETAANARQLMAQKPDIALYELLDAIGETEDLLDGIIDETLPFLSSDNG